ncbi:gamma-glutamyltransferase family protein [Agrobacterium tumefaciens]|uniref:gamma-glutamyltransferase family protein n=2 Tax=Agrobacterium tumefaciens TaxID=358 RepID=UPI000DD0B36B|nr:gamma-glutamyltransferase [Agrobacterium tumefaciens]UXS27057.1 gamma-glutamyltransferase [Agrobacterium tumefaciens]UXS54444.1 gamma-glutamyltransferase [Agrobacterium tumefaciens]UXS65582.1 gamma-glutamyltransferase [Agrobacterium tumefaciens]
MSLNVPLAARPGMVISPHPLASEAGAAVLRRGGNAIEAAVAIAATLAVVMPHFCGLGGDAVWLVADRQGLRRSFLGIGQAAAILPDYHTPIPLRGSASMITTACAVDSWGHALTFGRQHWQGREQLSDLLTPAIAFAENGYRPSHSQDFWLEFRRAEIAGWPGFAAAFDHPGSRGIFTQSSLAQTLRHIAEHGHRSFYEGELAARLGEAMASLGSPLTAADLQLTRTRDAEPVSQDYRGVTLLAPPPPTQGVSTLAILGILSRLDLAALPSSSAARYHLLVEAVKQAFLDREHIADSDFVDDNTPGLLDPMRLEKKARAIDRQRALEWPHPYQHGDTVFFAATDEQGRCASVLQSTYFDWGSGVVVGDSGIIWQNRGAAFSVASGHPNAIRPGKRPFYTLNPGIAFKDGVPHMLYGTQGADGQPQTLSLLLTGLLDYGMTPTQALAQPRFLLGRTFSDVHNSLKVEQSLGGNIIQELAALGHDVLSLPALSPIFGQAGVICIQDEGRIIGSHDPRGEGVAICVSTN